MQQQLTSFADSFPDPYQYKHFHCSATNLAHYSGVGVISSLKPVSTGYGLGVKDIDREGRVILCEFEKFNFVAVYVPNSGANLK